MAMNYQVRVRVWHKIFHNYVRCCSSSSSSSSGSSSSVSGSNNNNMEMRKNIQLKSTRTVMNTYHETRPTITRSKLSKNNPIFKESQESSQHRDALSQLKTGKELIAFLEKQYGNIDASVYARALQFSLTIAKSILESNNLLLKIIALAKEDQGKNFKKDIYYYNIVFAVLTNSHLPSNIAFPLIVEHFEAMMQQMSTSNDLYPDNVTLTALLRGVRIKGDRNISIANMFIDRLQTHIAKNQSHLKHNNNNNNNNNIFNSFAYTELIGIYSTHQQINKCEEFFRCIKHPDIVNYGALLNAYANIGDVEKIKKVIEKEILSNKRLNDKYPIIKTLEQLLLYKEDSKESKIPIRDQKRKYHHSIVDNEVIFGCLMKAFGKLNQPDQVISIFKLMIRNPRRKPIEAHWNLLLQAYFHLIQKHYNEKHEYLKKKKDILAAIDKKTAIDNTGNSQGISYKSLVEKNLQKYESKISKCETLLSKCVTQVIDLIPEVKKKLTNTKEQSWSQSLANLQLLCALQAYGDDFDKCVGIFERIMAEGYLGIWSNKDIITNQNSENIVEKQWHLNFCGISLINIRFLLRYLFIYSKEDLLHIVENGKKDLFIWCGSNVGGKEKIKKEKDMSHQIIVDELQSWEPSLYIKSSQKNVLENSANITEIVVDSNSIVNFIKQNGSCHKLSFLRLLPSQTDHKK